MPDGSLIVDTKIDGSGIVDGLNAAEGPAVQRGSEIGDKIGRAINGGLDNSGKVNADQLLGTQSILSGLNTLEQAALASAAAISGKTPTGRSSIKQLRM